MHEDLIKLLRSASRNYVVPGHTKRSLCAKAADALEAMQAEIRTLRNAGVNQAERIEAMQAAFQHIIVMCQVGMPEYSSLDIEDIARSNIPKKESP